MAYSTLASQSDTPTAGPDHTYFEAAAANFTAMIDGFGARISETAAQSWGATATYQVLFGTVDSDSSPTMTGTANRLTIPTGWAGTWLICPSVNVQGQSNGAGSTIQVKVRKNATTDVWESFNSNNGVGTNIQAVLTAPFTLVLAVADYVEVYGVSANLAVGPLSPHVIETVGVSLGAIWLHA